jgi:FKBP-type peptidyl-prolyl cis-trans isomerase
MDKKVPALQFKVGVGKVIKAWDHALLEMSVGEVAKLTVEPEWGYGAYLSVETCP